MILRLIWLVGAVCLSYAPSAGQDKQKQQDFRLEAGASYENLTNGYDHWTSYHLEGASRVGEEVTIVGAFQNSERFRLTDQQFIGGVHFPLSSQLKGYAEAAFSPMHCVVPQWSTAGEVTLLLGSGWNISTSARQSRYSLPTTTRWGVGLEWYWSDERFAYNVSLNATSGLGASTSHRFQWTHYVSEANSISLAASLGNEIEVLPFRGVTQSSILGIVLNGLKWFSEEWGLRYEMSWHQQGEHYIRKGVRFGICRAF
jgi:YaiO family outer membrane protein